ncbi:MAG TPA: trypsin-like peptidase domain-containing protein [Syntrophomonadaceae bacterium]|nr:trypsin-like peptidase domain-containing protein [Syntrophomonadaceae bacterium]
MNSNGTFVKILKNFLVIILAMVAGGVLLTVLNYKAAWIPFQEQESIAPQQQSQIVITGPTNIPDMVEKVSPAVVNIETSVSSSQDIDPFLRQFFGDNFMPKTNIQQGIGTGFIINEDGYLVTNQHVIDKASKITVTINDNKKYNAKVIGQDYELDLAVLKIDSDQKFSTLKMGDSDQIRVGEWVFPIGNPYGLDHTVTGGLISAKGRPMQIEDREYKNLIQTDAAINPGNSGGPLLNTNGEVIGINTAVNANAQGIGFAIPINTAKEVLNELIVEGKVIRPYIGIRYQAVDKELADYLKIPLEGVIVSNVLPNSPASKAGVQKYDVIVNIDDVKINESNLLNEVIASKQVNDTIVLGIIRDGKQTSISVKIAEKP